LKGNVPDEAVPGITLSKLTFFWKVHTPVAEAFSSYDMRFAVGGSQ